MIQSTNIRRILDRIMRHPMLRDIPFETAVEYTVDFIGLLGTPAIYDEKTAVVEVHDWRGQLPCDFVKMIQVRVAPKQHNCRWDHIYAIPPKTYRKADHSFHFSDYKPNAGYTGELTYKEQGMVIFTSTRDIDVEIAYTAFATDDEGYPLLPDNVSFLRGLENYIKLQWFTIKFDLGEILITPSGNMTGLSVTRRASFPVWIWIVLRRCSTLSSRSFRGTTSIGRRSLPTAPQKFGKGIRI